MSSSGNPPLDLIDLKFLPSWLKESEQLGPRYSEYEGETADSVRPSDRFGRSRTDRPTRDRRGGRKSHARDDPRTSGKSRVSGAKLGKEAARKRWPRGEAPLPARPDLEVRFLPRGDVLSNVVAQINAASVAYSVYALARLFLQRPERYEVRLSAKGDATFFRLAETPAIASDRQQIENIAFRLLRDKYYKVDVTVSEPIKGNFTSIARERSSGVLLGPTNHHGYQPQLRRLYEQRFSRRMEFREFQRQIEIVSDPALVEKWKEEARKISTFTPLKETSTATLSSETEAERDFREKYLPSLISEVREVVIDGVSSRSLRDRSIARVIEDAWSSEVRSPSNLMQELSGKLRGAGLQVFRHRKGMLFVSPVRPQLIDETAVSNSIRAILETVKTSPRINRKDLAGKLIDAQLPGESAEKAKMTLAADVRWLIREGHIIEFNDGSLDLPRSKPSPALEKSKLEETLVPNSTAKEVSGEAAKERSRQTEMRPDPSVVVQPCAAQKDLSNEASSVAKVE